MGRPWASENRPKPSLPAKPRLGQGFCSWSPARCSPTHLRGGSGRAGRLPAAPSGSGSAGSARSGARPCCRGSCGSGPRARYAGTAPSRRSTRPSGRCSCKLGERQEGWSASGGHGAHPGIKATSWGGWMSQRGLLGSAARAFGNASAIGSGGGCSTMHGADGCTHGVRKCWGLLGAML